jgi:O-antigen ligase
MHILWLLNSNNLDYALHDLKIKLPLLILPVIFGTTKPLSKTEIKIILHFFIASLLSYTIYSLVAFMDITSVRTTDYRSLSPVISHIRLALYIVLGIYINISFILNNNQYKYLPSIVYIIITLWLTLFIIFLGALTGTTILFIIAPFALLFWFSEIKNQKYKRIGSIVVILVFFLIVAYGTFSLLRFKQRIIVKPSELEVYTINGNKYHHFLDMKDYENKFPVWIDICEPELKREWNKISIYNYSGTDKRGQPLKGTLLRYLASLGYKKDSVGISKLDIQDIEMIQNGYTNYIYKKRFSLYPRLYQIFWEIENYFRYGNPSGHSLTQRIEYAKNALRAIKRNFWFGSGTGDIGDEIKYQYEIDDSILNEKWQLRAHNQIITFFLTFGIFGFILMCLVIYSTLTIEKSNIDFIAFTFLLIVLFSMLNEDTLETQAGATFFGFFFSLFIFGRNKAIE